MRRAGERDQRDQRAEGGQDEDDDERRLKGIEGRRLTRTATGDEHDQDGGDANRADGPWSDPHGQNATSAAGADRVTPVANA